VANRDAYGRAAPADKRAGKQAGQIQ
jgi:hypothetical protein